MSLLREAYETIDRRIADLVHVGQVRVAIMPPQYTRNPANGKLQGWAVDLAEALGARLGITAVSVEYSGPDKVLEGLRTGGCDVGFLPKQASWADVIDFSRAFLQFDFTFLVPAGSPVRCVAEVDRPDIRIAVVSNHASTLALVPVLRYATPISADTLEGGFDLLRSGRADAFASTRPQLLDDCQRLPGSRVLEDRYGYNFMSLVVPKSYLERLAYLNEFIQEAKTMGLVQRAIRRAGWRGVHVVLP